MNKKKALLFIFILALIFVVVGCSSKQGEKIEEEELATEEVEETASQSEIPEFNIVIETAKGESVEVTEKNVDEIGEATLTATVMKKDGSENENDFTGILLKDVLEYANVGDYSSLELEAADGFVVEYTKEMAESDGTILAYLIDGQPIEEEDGPIQSLIDGESSQYKVKQLVTIRVIN